VAGRGYFGVDVFFVLSGFLITALLIEERGARRPHQPPPVLARRALRLLPALVVVLAACAVYASLFPHRPDTQHFLRDAGATFGYVANCVRGGEPAHRDPLADPHVVAVGGGAVLSVWPLLLAFLLARRAKLTTVAVLAALGVLASVQYRGGRARWKGPLTAAMYNRDVPRARRARRGAAHRMPARAPRPTRAGSRRAAPSVTRSTPRGSRHAPASRGSLWATGSPTPPWFRDPVLASSAVSCWSTS